MAKNKNKEILHINLTPYDELQDNTWWIIDVVVIVAFLIASNVVGKFVTGKMNSEITKIDQEIAEVKSNINAIKSEGEKLSTLKEEIKKLQRRLDSYAEVGISDVNRYELLILLEYMQTLKPIGMWYNSLDIDTNDKKIVINGLVNDPEMISDFLVSLKSTQEEADLDDIRNRFFFVKIDLEDFRENRFSLPGIDLKSNSVTHKFRINFNYEIRRD